MTSSISSLLQTLSNTSNHHIPDNNFPVRSLAVIADTEMTWEAEVTWALLHSRPCPWPWSECMGIGVRDLLALPGACVRCCSQPPAHTTNSSTPCPQTWEFNAQVHPFWAARPVRPPWAVPLHPLSACLASTPLGPAVSLYFRTTQMQSIRLMSFV